MTTMTCCNNSEQIRFENLLKEGCEYKSEKKNNIRHSNKHLQNKWNSARFRFQKILAPDSIKCVCSDHIQQNQLHVNVLGDHHKSTQPDRKKKHYSRWLLSITCTRVTVPTSRSKQLVRPLSCLSRQISR